MRSKGLSARQASAYFNIPSFRSVIVWERKYISEGALSLFKETRGKGNFQTGSIKGRKPKAVELDKYETLVEENYRLRMENDYLKKLNALVCEREKSQMKIKQK